MPPCGRPRRSLALLALGCALAGPAAARAARPGDLDPSFAGDGRLALPASGPFVPRAVAVDSRRRIVVAGYTVLVPILGGAIANDLVIDRTGRAIAIGQAAQGSGFVFADARLHADGRPDAAFGSAGVATVGFDHYPVARATAGSLQADGRLVTAGLGCAGGGSGTTCRGGTAVLLLARQRAGSDATPPVIEVAVPQRLRRARLRRGIRLSVRTDEPARFDVQVPARGRPAPLLRIRRSELARTFVFRLRARSRLLGPRARLRLVIRASDADGNAAVRRFAILVG